MAHGYCRKINTKFSPQKLKGKYPLEKLNVDSRINVEVDQKVIVIDDGNWIGKEMCVINFKIKLCHTGIAI